jgi:bifunctional oligoribonuclease and PAP phosphatase NrnA
MKRELTPIPEDLLNAIRGAQRIALAGHVTPDADSLGAMLALWIALAELGKHAFLALPPGTASRRMEFLVKHAGARPAAQAELETCNVIVVLDTAKDRRVNLEGKLESLPLAAVVNVDHHATNPHYGRWNWVDAGRSSTCEMAYELIRALGCQITPTIATLIYAGIHSDTQGFSLVNTTPRSLLIAHELAAAGARIALVCEELERSLSRGEFELLGIVYCNTRTACAGRLAWSTVSHAEITRTGCDANSIDDQVKVPRALDGIQIAILFSEGDPGVIRINFRGESGVAVLPLAQQFGGGGHHASAGARVKGTLHEVCERVVAAACDYLERQ